MKKNRLLLVTRSLLSNIDIDEPLSVMYSRSFIDEIDYTDNVDLYVDEYEVDLDIALECAQKLKKLKKDH
jgi:hypothetical protein